MLKLYDPFEPFLVTQKWGNPNPAYKEAGFDFSLHNGIDARPSHTLSTYPVYCPLEDATVYAVEHHPEGGGHMLWLITNSPVEMVERSDCHALVGLFHAEKIFVKPGDKPKLGELIMIGDNTGFSTGPHTHIGLYRVLYGSKLTYVDSNEANRSFDPQIFRNGISAVDQASFPTLVKSNWRYYQYLLSL